MTPYVDGNSCVAVFGSREVAEVALQHLADSGVDMEHVSLLGRDPHSAGHPIGFHAARDRATYFGKEGAYWGGILGLILSPAFFWIPGIGPLLTGGIISSVLMGTLEAAAAGAVLGGTGGLVAGALTKVGIPDERVARYEAALAANKILVVIHGTAAEVKGGEKRLQSLGAEELHLHVQ